MKLLYSTKAKPLFLDRTTFLRGQDLLHKQDIHHLEIYAHLNMYILYHCCEEIKMHHDLTEIKKVFNQTIDLHEKLL